MSASPRPASLQQKTVPEQASLRPDNRFKTLSPFWGTRLTYLRAPTRKQGSQRLPGSLTSSSLVSFLLDLALEPDNLSPADQLAYTEPPSSLPDPALEPPLVKPSQRKHGSRRSCLSAAELLVISAAQHFSLTTQRHGGTAAQHPRVYAIQHLG